MSGIMHHFTEYVEPARRDFSALDESACVTGDPERMSALLEETDDLIRRAGAAGAIGQPIDFPSLEELSATDADDTGDDRCAAYQEQLAHLASLEYERREIEQIREAA